MAKFKKFFWVSIGCLMILSLLLVGCGQSKNKKYDVTIKIKNNYEDEWIFTPDISELTYEFEYTGEEMKFYLEYNLPDHPKWSEEWFTPTDRGANIFSKTMIFTDVEGKQTSGNRPVKDKGDYSICYVAHETSDLWNFRYVYLRISVK